MLEQSQPYNFILSVRDRAKTEAAFDELRFDTKKHRLTLLPLSLANLKGVKAFAQATLDDLGEGKLDYLFLNAAMIKTADAPGSAWSKWCEPYIVNHLCTNASCADIDSDVEADTPI